MEQRVAPGEEDGVQLRRSIGENVKIGHHGGAQLAVLEVEEQPLTTLSDWVLQKMGGVCEVLGYCLKE